MQFTKPRATPLQKLFPVVLVTLGSCLVTTVGGCRSVSDNQIDLLERELRTQEDYIYELEDYVLEYSQKLRQCRGTTPHASVIYAEPDKADPPRKLKSTTTRREAPPDEPIEPPATDEPADELPLPIEPEPEVEEPAPVEPENLDIPELEIGDPIGALNRLPGVEQVAAQMWDDEPVDKADFLFIPDPADFAPDDSVEQASNEQFDEEELYEDEPDSLAAPPYPIVPRVARQLEITQLFRGSGDSATPTSLLTIVEALDDNGEPVDLDGEVSLMVMSADAATPQRIKRWNFSDEETAAAWQSSQLGDGLHLELPLDEIQLPDMPLELWARLVLADGRKLLTQVAFEPPQLEGLDEEMQPAELPPEEGSQLAMIDARPIESADDTDADQSTEKSRPAAEDSRAVGNKPRWRASMERTDFVTQSSSTTAQGAKRWKAQPLGGRSTPSALARRPVVQSSQLREKGAGPKWQPFR